MPFNPAQVSLVGAGPGDPGLLTLRGVECLRSADVVIYDRLVNRRLLRHAPQAEHIDVGKQPDHHPIPQEQINALLIEHARRGQRVVRLKGGDPFVFGRGGEEALALVEAGISFEIVPGVTSAIAAPAYAGIPVTERDLACSVAFITGHRAEGCRENSEDWLQRAAGADTLVFLMGVTNLPAIVDGLLRAGRPSSTPVALVEWGSTSRQKVVTGTLEDIVEKSAIIHPPAVTVVGQVVELRQALRWFDSRPLFGLRILNTRPAEDESAFSAGLSALGAEVFESPAIQVVSPDDLAETDDAIYKLARLGQHSNLAQSDPPWDWLLFTSANAVRAFLDRIDTLGFDNRILGGLKLGAVGPATRRVLGEYRLKADFVPTRYTGMDWAAEAGDLAGQRLLLPRSAIAPPDLPDTLQARGAVVTSLTSYTVRPAIPDPLALDALLLGNLDLVTFFSPSAVDGLLGGLETPAGGREAALALLNRLAVACIGPTTTRAAQAAGLRVTLQADPFTADGLLDAILHWRAQS